MADTILTYGYVSQVFKDTTLYFSEGMPHLAKVIPSMDLIDAKLATKATNPTYAPSLRGAIFLSKKLLNKYYSMMDNSHVYQIAMSE